MLRRKLPSVVLACLASLAFHAAVAAPPESAGRPGGPGNPKYHGLVVFGDSLSDTGNDLILTSTARLVPAIPPSTDPHRSYFEGRFSNGPVAIEYLWQLIEPKDTAVAASLSFPPPDNKLAVSFAFGGSGSGGTVMNPGGFPVPGVLQQVEIFRETLQGKQANKHALYTIWTGANDYIFFGVTDPQVVVSNIVAAIETLHSLGARNFLVPDLPHMGDAPLIQQWGIGQALTLLTDAHNAGLRQALDGLSARLPDARIRPMDTNAFVRQALADGAIVAGPPAAELLAPGSGAADCLFREPSACPNLEVTHEVPPVMFWDVLHPSTRSHEVLGRAMFESLIR